MALHFWRDGKGYMALATPPHSIRPWTSHAPLSKAGLVEHADRLGIHMQDFWDAVQEADEGRPAPSADQIAQAMADTEDWRCSRGRTGTWIMLCVGAAMALGSGALYLWFAWVMHDFGGIPWSADFVRMNAGMIVALAVAFIGGVAMTGLALRRLR